MSVILGSNLLARLSEADPQKRLVVAPILEPTEQLSNDQASIDVRLGCDFRLATAANIGVLDEFAKAPDNHFSDLESVYKKIYVPLGGAVTIHPHQLMLAVTLEYVRLPSDLMAYVVGRSSLGRLGLIIATAIGVHPKFFGTLTLELRNLGEAPVRLYPGQTIAQLFFHEVEPATRPEKLWPGVENKVGQYLGANNPVPRRISSELTSKKLRKLHDDHVNAQMKLRSPSS